MGWFRKKTHFFRNLRYSAYRSIYLWLIKKRNKKKSFRKALPSCVVTYIRQLYPDTTYRGFLPATKSPIFKNKRRKQSALTVASSSRRDGPGSSLAYEQYNSRPKQSPVSTTDQQAPVLNMGDSSLNHKQHTPVKSLVDTPFWNRCQTPRQMIRFPFSCRSQSNRQIYQNTRSFVSKKCCE